MMKLAKRIVALAIVLCTVGAMMIPGVSAASNDLTVDFKEAWSAVGWTNEFDVWVFKGAPYTDVQAANDRLKAVNDNYSNSGWRLYYGANNQLVYNGNRFGIQSNYGTLHLCALKGNTAYLPLEIKAPATGNYTLTVNYDKSENDDTIEQGAYIVPAAASGRYSATTLPKSGSATVSHTGRTDFATNELTTKTSTDTVALEAGKEYVVVFFLKAPSNATLNELYTTFGSFSLNYKGAATGGSQSPNTGDAGMQLWFALMAVSCLGLGAMVVCKKKEA